MKHYQQLLLLTLCLFVGSSIAAQHTLEVNIESFKTQNGKVYIALYNNATDFLSDTELFRKYIGPVTSRTMTVTFRDLPSGTYALSVFHDANANDQLDTNFFGAPKESYGFSNNPKIWLRAPTFAESRLEISEDRTTIIQLKG